MMMDSFIGVDGGGTKTTGVLMARTGVVLERARTGSTNFNAVGNHAASATLVELIQTLLAKADMAHSTVRGVGLGISGVSTSNDQQVVKEWVKPLVPQVPVLVENDSVIALAAATGGELFGVTVISGTGMIVVGINRNGERQRVGGWGPLIGEPGGGFALGISALKAVADAEDTLGPPTILTTLLLEHLGLTVVREIVPWVYADPTWARFAALAPLVVQGAQQKDVVSLRLLDAMVEALSTATVAVARRLGLGGDKERFPCVLAGGNLTPGLLADRLTACLQERLPAAQVCLGVDPALGAAFLAMRQSG
jgi:N-acetylglucosamine kinase-like BadF-type ATPase